MSIAAKGLICLGIDPGLARVGYGVVLQTGSRVQALSYGCIETSPKTAFSKRLEEIYNALGEQVTLCSPDFVSVERLFFGRNTTTAEFVWQARGVIMLLAAQQKLEVLEPKPSQVKMAVCSNGNADKAQVQRMVQRLLGLDSIPSPDDAADALAVALAGLSYYTSAQKLGVSSI